MADRPILFSAPMVRALLDGRKTQTRRILKPQPFLMSDAGSSYIGYDGKGHRIRISVGDRLWVRETWSGHRMFSETPPAQRVSFTTPDGPYLREDVWFWADGDAASGDWERPRPGIHMPRWASRLTLTVTDVRVERLQNINWQDAEAEGVWHSSPEYREKVCIWRDAPAALQRLRVEEYGKLWDRINGPGAWDANPWVAAYTFTVERKNIDEVRDAT